METEPDSDGAACESADRATWFESTMDLLLYAALAVASTWPLVLGMRERLPLGPYRSATVTLATEWALFWNANRLAHLGAGYWDAPIFAPAHGMFALSEPQPLSGLVFAPVYALSGSLELSYDVVLLATLTLNGWFMSRVLRRAGLGRAPTVIGGAMMVLLPFVHTELGVLPFIAVWGALATLEAWLAFAAAPTLRGAAWLGAAVAASYFLSCQQTLLFLVALAVGVLVSVDRRVVTRRTALLLAVAMAVGAVLVAPVVWRQLDAARDFGMARDAATVRGLSVGVDGYLVAPWRELWHVGVVASSPRRAYYPGTLKVVWLVVAIVLASRRRAVAPVPRLAFGMAAASVVIGFGPLIDVGPVSVYGTLSRIVPGFRQVRGVFHAAVFAQMGVVIVAAWAMDACARSVPPRLAGRVSPRVWRGACLALGVLSVVELWPEGQRFAEPTSFSRQAGWTEFVRTRTPESATLAFVPFPQSGHVEDFEPTAEWMRLGAAFERRIVNGYSSYFPKAYDRLALRMKSFPDEGSLGALRGAGVTYVLVDTHRWNGAVPESSMTRVLRDGPSGMDVYALHGSR